MTGIVAKAGQRLKKCPECGAIVQDEDKCGVCGAALLEVRSEPLEYLLKEQAGKPPGGKQDIHWKRRALRSSLVFLCLSIGLIVSGFLLLIYSQPLPGGLTPLVIGFLLLSMGFLVLLYMVIGAGPSERGMGWRVRR